ncbi:cytochrome oxidase assembly protein [Castellaniella hirudinis]|uniref:Cytochrome oxidase assembly protein n=1 Tax=Castellaniella hirudinis TaxID=1144617 RepID=A0ABV8RVX2_9BURK
MSASAPFPDRSSLRATRRLRMLRAMAWTCAALVLVIIGLSAHIRLTRAGAACEPRSQCLSLSSQASRADAAVGSGEPAPAVRTAHRAAASATLLLVLAMLALTLSAQPARCAERRLVLGLLGLTLCLAVLGLWGRSSLHPAVTLGNLLGGFALFALCTRLARTATAPVGMTAGAATDAPARRWVRPAILLVLAQIALGSLMRVDAAWLHAAHRATGLALAALLLTISWRLWRQGERALAAALTILPSLLAALGLALTMPAPPPALILAHNLCAALLLAALASLRR